MGMALPEASNGAAVGRRAVLAGGIDSAFAVGAAHADVWRHYRLSIVGMFEEAGLPQGAQR